MERLKVNPGRTARIYERGSERDVAGAYNGVWLQQPGDPAAARTGRRTSQIVESTCHEGNFRMTGMLSNTRAAERAFAERRGPEPATQDIASGGMGSALPEGVGRGVERDIHRERPA